MINGNWFTGMMIPLFFVKNDNRFKEIIDKFEYKYVNPYYYIFDKEPLKNATYSDPQRITEGNKEKY